MTFALPFINRKAQQSAGGLFIAALLTGGSGAAWAQSADCLSPAAAVSSVSMRVLVISADGNEAVLPAIKSILSHVGVPYDLMIARDQVLTASSLCDGTNGLGHARYQGVLLTTGNLGFDNGATGFESAFTLDEWNLLWAFEAKYRIRQATFYTVPGVWPDNYGLGPATAGLDTSLTPLQTSLTSTAATNSGNPAGRLLFRDLQPLAPISISNAYTYLAKALDTTVTPLLTDASGNLIASIKNYPDGRKNLALTTDGNPYLSHTLKLGYGIVNWVTKGVYIGQRKAYLTAQPDDVLLADDIWTPATGTDTTGKTYRITANDYKKFVNWQNSRNANFPGNIVIEIPFNASGATTAIDSADLFPATTDDLTPAIKAQSAPFNWLSHTFTHLNLDSPTTYSQTLSELRQNHTTAIQTLRLANYNKDALITPDVSGLNNPEALRAMSDFGIRYVVSNTSLYCGNRNDTQPPRPCPAPNQGVYNDLQPNILMVPRYPANLFYNVCTPDEWVSEYNQIYRGYWGRDLSYQEILGKESDVWLRYLLNFDMRPVMFHQPNMCAYDGTHSLLGDLIDVTTAKFRAISVLPPQSRPLRTIGNLMAQRMALEKALAPATGAALGGQIIPGAAGSSIVLSNPTTGAVTVPVTGVNFSGAASVENYGGQSTSKLLLGPGATVTVTGVPAW